MTEPSLNLQGLVCKRPLYKVRFKPCNLHLYRHVLGYREHITIFPLKIFKNLVIFVLNMQNFSSLG